MSLLGAPTGLSSHVPPAAKPVPPQVAAVASGSQYLRFKRRNQTLFLPCEPGELLGAVKARLAAILAVEEDDIRLYEYMSAERKAHVMSVLEEKVKEAAKLRKRKAGEPKPNLEEELRAIEIPPLPEEKKLFELGLENDAIVFFVYRCVPNTDWEEWEEPHVPGLQESTGKTLGSSAGQMPGGDGFGEPGSAAARAAALQAEQEAAAAKAEAEARAQREEEARLLEQAAQQEQQAQE